MTRVLRFACAVTLGLCGLSAFASPVVHRGKTYQPTGNGWALLQDGRSYPVIADLVTVRFAEGIEGLDGFRAALLRQGGPAELAQLEAVRVNALGIHDLEILPTQDPLRIAAALEATGLVRYAEVNTTGFWTATPSDPRFPEQWHLRNTGQLGGKVDGDLDADEAWDLTAGAAQIVVGVLDSGTDIDHVDLVENLWKNAGEVPGNNQDDDGNGYVDDYDGWNFEAGNGNPRSTNGHGTNVAGIVAARTDNGTGVAGIAGGFGAAGGARLMPVKVGTSGPNGAILDDAILYAANNGARIITMSLTVGQTAAIDDALAYAYNTKGVFIDCASGNSSSASVGYPSSRPEVMAVGATDRFDNRASWSNYGSDLEVVAPGVDVLTTGLSNTYQTNSGTSFSAPCVAGVAALLFSYNPALTNAQVRQTLKDTADDVGAAGYDLQTGYGRVNARRALDATVPPNCEDVDGDGYYPIAACGTPVDCDDTNAAIRPGAPEVCRDGIDQNCDGVDQTKGKGCNKR